MPFINEYISENDRELYDLSLIKKPPLYRDPTRLSKWTIDRPRDIFLVWTKGGDEDHPHECYFALWWKGAVLNLRLQHVDEGDIKTHVTSTWSLEQVDIPGEFDSQRHEIIRTLKEALCEYRVSGVGVPVASHSAKFTF